MARAKTKTDLMKDSSEKYIQLMALIDSIPSEKRMAEFTFDITKKKEAHWKRDRNIRDILIHLYEWHQLLIQWVESNLAGVEKQFLKEGYNWRTYGEMNVEFWQKHQETSYEDALSLVEKSHEEVMLLADKFSNEELFSKGVFPWVGGSTLGSYFVSVSSSHYDWAIKKIREFKKSLKN